MAKQTQEQTQEEKVAGVLRDRVVELRRVPSEELLDNEKNWRTHPYAQQAAVTELLDQVGIVGALTAYHSERHDGKLTLIDGHERRTHQADWPVLVLDVTDEEADLLLLTLDPMVGLAETDAQRLDALLQETEAGTPGLVDLMQTLAGESAEGLRELLGEDGQLLDPDRDDRVIPEMELQPFEHYDYVVLLCRNTYDFMALQDLLELETVKFTLPVKGRAPRVGMGRVIDAKRVIEKLKATDAA